MKKSFFLFVCLLFNFSLFSQDPSYVPGEIILQLGKGHDINSFIAKFSISNRIAKVTVKERLSGDWNVWLLKIDEQASVQQMIERFTHFPEVSVVGLNRKVSQRAIPNDTNFVKMWDMNNTGQTGGLADADIDAPEAWNIDTGGVTASGDTIVVAVIDGGFDIKHEDLNYWKNYGEIPANGIDDDLNGYIDDYNGWNVYNNSGNISSDQHGTHVAGTVGAIGNNGKGVTGVNWNVKVMAIQGASSNEAEVVKAYDYVYKARKLYNQTNGLKGTFVVSTNASFGVDYGDPADYPLWCGIYDSLGTVGVLSAGATANLNVNVDTQGDIPTACPSPYLITVTNTTKSDTKYSGAGYGLTTIDLGAPGTDIWSTLPNNSYGGSGWTGTSMATPHVAGAIALMYAAACPAFMVDYKADPASLALKIKEFLLNSTDSILSLTNKTVTDGRLNLHKALMATQQYGECGTAVGVRDSKTSPSNFKLSSVYPNPVTSFAKLQYESANAADIEIIIIDVLGNQVKAEKQEKVTKGIHKVSLDLSGLPNGIYIVTLKSGPEYSNSLKLTVLN